MVQNGAISRKAQNLPTPNDKQQGQKIMVQSFVLSFPLLIFTLSKR